MSTAAVTMGRKVNKESFVERIWNFLLENVDIIAPGISLANGQYYPGNYKRQ